MPRVAPPIAPMLAALARELPLGDYAYEPKWDGFRALAFVEGEHVQLRSRNERPLARYFPELVSALGALGARSPVLDGEIVIWTAERADFGALLNRTHPSESRVARLARETPATFIAFDLLACDDEDLRGHPFAARRAKLEALLANVPPSIRATEATRDPALASRWLSERAQRGIDGVVAKHVALPYSPGKRTMIKVKPERTVDCVLAGMRLFEPGPGERDPTVASLLLGLWDGDVLRHVGVSSSFPAKRRRELLSELRGEVVPLAGHPWEHGFQVEASPMGRLPGAAARWAPGEMELDWIPLRPERVVEVAYDHTDAARFRHPARFVRWRPDRDARSCAIEQLS